MANSKFIDSKNLERFKKVPWEDEILFALNEDSQICQKEV